MTVFLWLSATIFLAAEPLPTGVLASPIEVYFVDGSYMTVQSYEVREKLVLLLTPEGKLHSVLRSLVDMVATELGQQAILGESVSGGTFVTKDIPLSEQVRSGKTQLATEEGQVLFPSHLTRNNHSQLSGWDRDVESVIDGPSPPEPPAVVNRDANGRVTMRAIRLNAPLTIDGKLEEEVYRGVPGVSGFIQAEPRPGELATEKTEVWVLFDDHSIYVAARCWDSHPERMVMNEMRRDNTGIFGTETLTVIFDTFYDRRNAFFFYTNPLGALSDSVITDERHINRDWNTVWTSRASRFENGWMVEMAFPFKSLRYPEGGSQIWGINFRRVVRWKNELSYLSPVPPALGAMGISKVSSAGTLVGLETPFRSGNFEVKPYAISNLVTDRNADPPLAGQLEGDIGFDLKYGLTRGLITDFTYNTDFAQVEADEQQVNLTRFSLLFPEKREFFLEGQGIFDFGDARSARSLSANRRYGTVASTPVLFFSRRIGLYGGEEVPIRAGGRLTGRAGRYSIGLLNIHTEESSSSKALATNFSVLRFKRDILRRSSIGVIATNRSVGLSGEGSNQVFGLDTNLAFYENIRMNGYFARSQTTGLSGDSDSYRGFMQYDGDRYGAQLERLVVEENFNPEMGFLRRRDFQRNFVEIRFSPRPVSIEAVRKFTWQSSLDYTTDNRGRLETRIGKATFRTEFESSDRLTFDYTRNFEFLPASFEISEGIVLPLAGYNFQDVRIGYELGRQRRLSGNFSFLAGGFFNGERKELRYRGRLGITKQLSVEPILSFNWIDLEEGSFTAQLVGGRVNYSINPRSLFSALWQYNSTNDFLSSNIRFRWEYQPGNDLFVVYSDERNTFLSGYPVLENRSFIIKFTRLFRF